MSTNPVRGKRLGATMVCGLIGIYHIAAGVSGLVGGAWAARAAELAFGVPASSDLWASDQTMVLARFVAALALAFGIVMLAAAASPAKCRPVFLAGIVYFAVRLVTRIVTAQQLHSAMGIAGARNLRSMVSILILLIGLVVFFPRPNRVPEAEDAP